MKIVWHLGGITHCDRIRQHRVEPAPHALERDRSLGAKAGDLTTRVHACIRARGADHRCFVREQLRERLFEVLLHGRRVVLALPTVELTAVILDDESDVAHGGSVLRTSLRHQASRRSARP